MNWWANFRRQLVSRHICGFAFEGRAAIGCRWSVCGWVSRRQWFRYAGYTDLRERINRVEVERGVL